MKRSTPIYGLLPDVTPAVAVPFIRDLLAALAEAERARDEHCGEATALRDEGGKVLAELAAVTRERDEARAREQETRIKAGWLATALRIARERMSEAEESLRSEHTEAFRASYVGRRHEAEKIADAIAAGDPATCEHEARLRALAEALPAMANHRRQLQDCTDQGLRLDDDEQEFVVAYDAALRAARGEGTA